MNQSDSDEDGYGNICNPDLDNNLIVQATDLAIFKPLFFTTDPHADFDCNGIVQAADLAIMKKSFILPPGPSCIAPWCYFETPGWFRTQILLLNNTKTLPNGR